MSRLLRRFFRVLVVSAIFPVLLLAQSTPPSKPITIKVVVVAMFERGEDTGDTPGEYQLWAEREHLDQIIPLPAGYHHVRLNKDGVLGILTGVGTAKAAASVMAVGLTRLMRARFRKIGRRAMCRCAKPLRTKNRCAKSLRAKSTVSIPNLSAGRSA